MGHTKFALRDLVDEDLEALDAGDLFLHLVGRLLPQLVSGILAGAHRARGREARGIQVLGICRQLLGD